MGYVSAAGGPDIDIETVKDTVAQSLPDYMVPTAWWSSSSSCSTAGKVGPKHYPPRLHHTLLAEYVAPVGETKSE